MNALAPPLPYLLMNSKIASLSCSVFSVCLCMVLKFFVFFVPTPPVFIHPYPRIFPLTAAALAFSLAASAQAPRIITGPAPVLPPTTLRTPTPAGHTIMPLIRQIQTVMPNGSAHPGAATLMQAGPESGLIYATPYEYPYTLGPATSILEYPIDSSGVLGKHSYTCLTTQTPQVPEPPSAWAVDSHALHGCTLVLGGMTSHTMLYFVNVSALPYLHVL